MYEQCKARVTPRNIYPRSETQCSRGAVIGGYCGQHHDCWVAGTLTNDGKKKAVPTWRERFESLESANEQLKAKLEAAEASVKFLSGGVVKFQAKVEAVEAVALEAEIKGQKNKALVHLVYAQKINQALSK